MCGCITNLQGNFELPPFVIENRLGLGQVQDLAALHKRFDGPGSLLLKCMDLHVLYFLATNIVVPLKVYPGGATPIVCCRGACNCTWV